jgi:signal transduction histidine kinase
MPTPLKLLILEDSASDAELEVGQLQTAGYDCDWQRVQTRKEFEACLDRADFELVLADYSLPSFDGLSALRLLRERGLEIPFILISGTLGEERAIESLKAGATDYVMKEGLERLAPVVTRALNDRLELGKRRAAQQALRGANRRLQTLSVRLLQVEETERRRIARELHDGVGQLLTAVKLRLAGLNPSSADFGSRRGECVAAIDDALEQVRRVSRDLRPSQLDDLGLVAALRSHLDRQAGSAGFKPNFAQEGVPPRLAAEIETTCFRIAQEALTNIARHAQASEVWVTLAGTEGELRLEVRDNGRGFDVTAARLGATAGRSMGLLSMEERATLAGGRLAIDSAPGRETRLTLALPTRRNLDFDVLARGGAGQA